MPYQGFSQLPVDLLVEIFLGISAFSRISLRQTCKALYDASKDRTIWICCLEKMIKECGLFGPSFQYALMTSEQLEAAANMQLRFRCNLAQGRTSAENVPFSPLLPIDPSSTELSLVPGGRFLVSFHENLLELWDLGIIGCGSRKPLFLASTPCSLPSEKTPFIEVTFEPGSAELFITIGGYGREGGHPKTTWRTIYTICPLDHSPTFNVMGQLNSELFGAAGVSFFDIPRSIVAFGTAHMNEEGLGGDIWLWYIAQNALVWWTEGAQTCKMWVAGNGNLVVIPSPGWYGGAIDCGYILAVPRPPDFHPNFPPHCVKIFRPLLQKFSWNGPNAGVNDSTYLFNDRPLASLQMISTSTFDSVAYVHGKRGGEPFNALAVIRYNLRPSDNSSGDLTLHTVHETLFEGSMDIPFKHGYRNKDIGTHMEGFRLLCYENLEFHHRERFSQKVASIIVHISSVSLDSRPYVEQHKLLRSIPGVGQYSHIISLFSLETGRVCVGKEGGLSIVDFGCAI
ncbi:hypothetical protein DL96DRAFT_109195 [Flagelloscypha sp. PMI_526]|nr:hypothetical protein DL96DRAFT_109195 [Flagelloscypha sp. PMI_526]